jgi:hypothetical protein
MMFSKLFHEKHCSHGFNCIDCRASSSPLPTLLSRPLCRSRCRSPPRARSRACSTSGSRSTFSSRCVSSLHALLSSIRFPEPFQFVTVLMHPGWLGLRASGRAQLYHHPLHGIALIFLALSLCQVPASFPLKLNTSSFRLLIPALFNKYPNMGFNVVVDAVGNPLTLTVSPSLLSFPLRLSSQSLNLHKSFP